MPSTSVIVHVPGNHLMAGLLGTRDELLRMVKDLESQMKKSAKDLEFEKASLLRDQIIELRRIMEVDPVLG